MPGFSFDNSRDRAAFDRYLTTQPEPDDIECPCARYIPDVEKGKSYRDFAVCLKTCEECDGPHKGCPKPKGGK